MRLRKLTCILLWLSLWGILVGCSGTPITSSLSTSPSPTIPASSASSTGAATVSGSATLALYPRGRVMKSSSSPQLDAQGYQITERDLATSDSYEKVRSYYLEQSTGYDQKKQEDGNEGARCLIFDLSTADHWYQVTITETAGEVTIQQKAGTKASASAMPVEPAASPENGIPSTPPPPPDHP